MDLPFYLAMTPGEFQGAAVLPRNTGWMSCHFSAFTSGLSNFPQKLPQGSLLILDDSVPMAGHDPGRIYSELEDFLSGCPVDGLLLDFQREPTVEMLGLAKKLSSLPCPVAVTERYAKELSCAVFLPPCPAYVPLEEYIGSRKGGDIWLEVGLTSHTLTLTEAGCQIEDSTACQVFPHAEEKLCCHYDMQTEESKAIFSLKREKEDVVSLLAQAEHLKIRKAVGLYQELGK